MNPPEVCTDRIDELERRVQEIEDKFLTLISCVVTDPGQQFLGKLLELDIAGTRRVVLNAVLSAVPERARGEQSLRPRTLIAGLGDEVADAFDPGPITREQAIRYVAAASQVAPQVAEELLVAHRDSGLGADGHRALGT